MIRSIDASFVASAIVWSAAALLAFGVVSAIIPNPVFGREIAPEPFAVVIWLVSAPLVGMVGATYMAPAVGSDVRTLGAPSQPADRGWMATIGGVGAFLAIGCPVCNKLALLLLGTSGALTVFAPIQPFLGAASLVLLAGTLAWRLRLRVRGNACRV